MNELSFYLAEGRRVFSICPDCGEVHRLSNLSLAKKGKHEPDWLDEIEGKQLKVVEALEEMEAKKKALQAEARNRAEMEQLPKLLEHAAPAFVGAKIDPRDVRVLFDPVEFIVFEGMNTKDGVQGVSLLHLGRKGLLLRSIAQAIEGKNLGWSTLHVDDDGKVTVSRSDARK